MLGRDRVDRVHIGGVAEQVNRDDAHCLRPDRGGHPPRIEAPGFGIDVHEHGRRVTKSHGIGCRHERGRRHDHLVAPPDAERGQGEVEGGGAVRAGHGVPRAAGGRKLPLKSLQELAAR